MGLLSRKNVLEAEDLVIEKVDLSEFKGYEGGFVYVRNLGGLARDKFEGSLVGKDGKTPVYDNIRAKLVARTACDETGKRLFTDADIDILTMKSAAMLQKIFEVAQRLSGIGAKDIEEMTANLKNAQSGDSTSDSPVT